MEVSLSLPFQVEPNTGMGILFKGYADAIVCTKTEIENEENAEELLLELKNDIIAGAQDGFPMVRDVRAELNRGFRFWDAVCHPLSLSLSLSSNKKTLLGSSDVSLIPVLLGIGHENRPNTQRRKSDQL
jgi:hypothetical protein